MDHDEAVRLRVAELARDVAVLPDPRGAAQQLWSELGTDPSSRVLARSKTVLRARAPQDRTQRGSARSGLGAQAAGILDGLGPGSRMRLPWRVRLAEGELEEALRLFLRLGSVERDRSARGSEVARNLRLQELRGRFNISKTHAKVLHEAAILAAIRALAPDSLVQERSQSRCSRMLSATASKHHVRPQTGHMGLAWVTLRRVAGLMRRRFEPSSRRRDVGRRSASSCGKRTDLWSSTQRTDVRRGAVRGGVS